MRLCWMASWLLMTALVGVPAMAREVPSSPTPPPDEEDEFEFDEEEPLPEKPPVEKPPADKKPPGTQPAPPPPPPPPPVDGDDLEDDEIEFDDEEEPEPGDKPGDKPEDKPFLDDEDERDDAELLAPGTDNAEIYRAKEEELGDLSSDEEVMAWEAYLKEYPNSIFRKRIEDHIDELVAQQFRMRIDDPVDGGEDADKQELRFSQPMHMVNVNPRTAVQLAVDFGFPTFLGLKADFEYAFLRQLSAHAGIQGRYAGWEFDVGARYAFVKSTRLQFVATLVADIGVNFNQRVSTSLGEDQGDANRAFFVARPQLAFGKIIGPAQLLLSMGAEIGTRDNQGVAILGGLHFTYRLAPPVGIFAETDVYLRNLTSGTTPMTFDVISFGFKFYPMSKKKADPLELGMGGHIPYASKYLQYYLGAVQAQGTYYLPNITR